MSSQLCPGTLQHPNQVVPFFPFFPLFTFMEKIPYLSPIPGRPKQTLGEMELTLERAKSGSAGDDSMGAKLSPAHYQERNISIFATFGNISSFDRKGR